MPNASENTSKTPNMPPIDRVMTTDTTESATSVEVFEPTASDKENSELDAILTHLGQFGKFQLYILLLIIFPMLFNAIFSVTYVFTSSSVVYRCNISECDTRNSAYFEDWTAWSIPSKNNELNSCYRYASIGQANQTMAQNLCYAENFNKQITEKCSTDNLIFRDREVTIANEFGIYCNDEWKLTLVGTINNVGQFIGIPIGGYLSDRYGRATTLALCGFMAGFFGLLRSFSPSYIVFLIFEFLDTLTSGTLYSTCFIIGIELVGPKKRVVTCSLITIFYAVGEILLALVAKYTQNWRVILRIVYTPAMLQLALIWVLPESIRWLLSQGKDEQAKNILRRAAQVNNKQLSEESLDSLVLANRKKLLNADEAKFPLKEAFSKLFWRIANCAFCWIVNVLVYYGISLNAVLLDGDKYNNFMLIALVEIPGFLLPNVLMDRIGRRYALFSTMLISGLSCLSTIFISADKINIQLAMFLLGKLAITTSFQVLYFFSAEIFPTNLRNSLISFCSMVGRFGSMLAPQTPLLAKYNKNAPSILFATTAILSGSLALFFPETTNLVLPATMKDAHDIKTTHNSTKTTTAS